MSRSSVLWITVKNGQQRTNTCAPQQTFLQLSVRKSLLKILCGSLEALINQSLYNIWGFFSFHCKSSMNCLRFFFMFFFFFRVLNFCFIPCVRLILLGIADDLEQMKSPQPCGGARIVWLSLFVCLTVVAIIEPLLIRCPTPSFCLSRRTAFLALLWGVWPHVARHQSPKRNLN